MGGDDEVYVEMPSHLWNSFVGKKKRQCRVEIIDWE